MPQQPPEPGDQNSDPGVELPEDSLFSLEEYLDMYRVASSEPAFQILYILDDQEKLSARELAETLDRDANNLYYYLRKLKRSALIRNRRNPNTGTEETYSYYELTDLGHIVLSEGLKTGIQKMVAEEHAITGPPDD